MTVQCTPYLCPKKYSITFGERSQQLWPVQFIHDQNCQIWSLQHISIPVPCTFDLRKKQLEFGYCQNRLNPPPCFWTLLSNFSSHPFGAIWSHLEPFGAIWAMWSHFEPFGAIWSHLEPFGANWRHLEAFGGILSHFEPFGPISSHFEPFVVICSHLKPFEAIGSDFERFGAIWSDLEHFRAIWSH